MPASRLQLAAVLILVVGGTATLVSQQRALQALRLAHTDLQAQVKKLEPASRPASPAPAVAPAPTRHPDAKDTYTITTTLQLVQPFDPAAMTDDYQDARVIAQDADSCTVEITSYPLFRPTVTENPNWRQDYAGMKEFLRPTPTENWDEKMRADLLVELRAAGIDPDRLSDKQLVEQVSRWAMRRAQPTQAFAVWTIHFPAGQPAVLPTLRTAFDREKQHHNPTLTDEQAMGQEVLGRSMFYAKVHGSCTSSSIYLTTIFRALGLPTRIVFCIPPFDANDPKQAEMFYGAIHHHAVRETVRKALDGMHGFANHLFNEVYVGHRWVRLNYANLNQPILDEHYFGLLTHIYTTADLSQVPLAETWGARYFRYPAGQPRLSSVNPYRLVAVRDAFGANAHVENPVVAPPPELTTATILEVLPPFSPALPAFVANGLKQPGRTPPDLLISIREWIPTRNHVQLRTFQSHVDPNFVLRAEGHPDLHAKLRDSRWSQGDGSFQAFAADVVPADREKITPTVAYTVEPVNTNGTTRWATGPTLPTVILRQ